jgi:hypothetical protein
VNHVRLFVITPVVWNSAEDFGMPSAYRPPVGFRDEVFEVHVLMPPWPEPTYHGLRLHAFCVPRFGQVGDGPDRPKIDELLATTSSLADRVLVLGASRASASASSWPPRPPCSRRADRSPERMTAASGSVRSRAR